MKKNINENERKGVTRFNKLTGQLEFIEIATADNLNTNYRHPVYNKTNEQKVYNQSYNVNTEDVNTEEKYTNDFKENLKVFLPLLAGIGFGLLLNL